MLSYVTADINCPTCFNQVIETITAIPGVHTVAPHLDTGCLAITHDLDDAELLATITTIGHTMDIAPNGEITMGHTLRRFEPAKSTTTEGQPRLRIRDPKMFTGFPDSDRNRRYRPNETDPEPVQNVNIRTKPQHTDGKSWASTFLVGRRDPGCLKSCRLRTS